MTQRILVIDDDSNICKFLSEFLKLKGFEVKVFMAAEPALESIAEERCDMALVDIMLPGMSGIEFCQHYRQHDPEGKMPILLMTAFSEEAEQLKEGRESLGFIDCLFKPFTLPELHKRISEILQLKPAQETLQSVEVKGRLEETPFAQLLHDLYTLKSTGLLQVERGNLKKVIYIKDGYPIFARSNVVKECLGQMLVDQGLISAEQCRQSLELAKQSGRLQGTVLIEMGFLSPHQLHEELRRQVLEKLLEVFSWSEGGYQFIQGKDFRKGITGIDLSPAELIHQGIRRHYSADRLIKLLVKHRNRYLAPSESPHYRYQDIGFSNRGQKIFALCRGNLTLEEIIDRYPLARTESYQLLASLLLSGMIESRETPLVAEQDDDSLLSAKAQQLRQQLLEDYSRMIQQDYFTLLGVTPEDSKANMRKTYFALAKHYHPDRFLQYGFSEEFKGKLNELFQRIGEAYETVSNPTRCKVYRQTLKQNCEKKRPKIEDILRAETEYHKGRSMLRVNRFDQALKHLQVAYDISPEEPEYITSYAWALFKHDPANTDKRERAKQILQQSLHLNSELDLSHLYLGFMLQTEQKFKEAEKRFELAIQCNPDCTEAFRELRLSNLRKKSPPPADKKGLLNKIFKKK